MADLYMQMCMKCQVTQDCYAYEDGYICMECFDVEMEDNAIMTVDLDTFETYLTYGITY